MTFTYMVGKNFSKFLSKTELLAIEFPANYFLFYNNCTLIPALNIVTAVVVLTKALVSGFLSSTLQHKID